MYKEFKKEFKFENLTFSEILKTKEDVDFEKNPDYANGSIGLISGIAVPYGVIDSDGDRFVQGAFADQIGKTVFIAKQHSKNEEIGVGVLTDIGNGIGLEAKLDLSKSGSNYVNKTASETYSLIKQGAPYQLSIGGYYVQTQPVMEGVNTVNNVTKAVITEVSIVRVGAVKGAVINTVKEKKDISKGETKVENTNLTPEQINELVKVELEKAEKARQKKLEKENEANKISEMEKALKEKESKIEEMEKASKENHEAIVKELDELKKARNVVPTAIGDRNAEIIKEEMAQFHNFLKTGRKEELKYMEKAEYAKAGGIFDTTSGSALIPQNLADNIITKVIEYTPFLQLAFIYRGSTPSIDIPVLENGTNAVEDLAETGANTTAGMVSATTSILNIASGVKQLEIQLTDSMIMGSAFNIENILMNLASKFFAQKIGQQTVNGTLTSNNFIEGFLSNPLVTDLITATGRAYVTSAVGVVDVTDITKAKYQLKQAYRGSAVMFCNANTIAVLGTLKDSTGRPLWYDQLGNTQGLAGTFLGMPVYEAVEMPDIATGAFPILIADFNSFYGFYLRQGLETEFWRVPSQRINQTFIRMFLGGKVLLPEACVVIKVK